MASEGILAPDAGEGASCGSCSRTFSRFAPAVKCSACTQEFCFWCARKRGKLEDHMCSACEGGAEAAGHGVMLFSIPFLSAADGVSFRCAGKVAADERPALFFVSAAEEEFEEGQSIEIQLSLRAKEGKGSKVTEWRTLLPGNPEVTIPFLPTDDVTWEAIIVQQGRSGGSTVAVELQRHCRCTVPGAHGSSGLKRTRGESVLCLSASTRVMDDAPEPKKKTRPVLTPVKYADLKERWIEEEAYDGDEDFDEECPMPAGYNVQFSSAQTIVVEENDASTLRAGSARSWSALSRINSNGPDDAAYDFSDEDEDPLLREYGFVKLEEEEDVDLEALEKQKEYAAKLMASSEVPMNAAMRASIKGWPSYQQHTVLTYPMFRSILELNRQSKYKQQAYELGLIRPFLLLVSMHPEARVHWAQVLNVQIWNKHYSGDSHQEAFAMLVNDSNSIQSRDKVVYSKEGDWYQILYRLSRKVLYKNKKTTKQTDSNITASAKPWQQTEHICKNSRDAAMLDMEETFLRGVIEMFDAIRVKKKMPLPDSTLELINSDRMNPLLVKMRLAGYKDEHLMRRLAATTFEGRINHVVEGLNKYCNFQTKHEKFKRFMRFGMPISMMTLSLVVAATVTLAASPLLLLPAFQLTLHTTRYTLFNQLPFEVLLPIIGICHQREVLAYHNIVVDDFYPTPRKRAPGVPDPMVKPE